MSQAQPGEEGEEEDIVPQATAAPHAVGEPFALPRQIGGAYRSRTLGAKFIAEWMFIVQQGRRYEFWGARIVGLEPWSPLRQLKVRTGDVLTRLDGITIARGMRRTPDGSWQIPELERHFGRTEVRYIVSGTNRVRIGDMLLDWDYPEEEEGVPEPVAP